LYVCVTDFARLFNVLDSLEGGVDECHACIMTVILEAERFKRQSLAQKLQDFLQRRLTQSSRHLPSAVKTSAASSLTRTLHSTPSVAVNCNHMPDTI